MSIPKWLSVAVTTQTAWPKEKKEIKYGNHTFILMPRTRDNFASIHIQLVQMTDIEGYTIIDRFLSALSWKDDNPAITHYHIGRNGAIAPGSLPKHQIPFGADQINEFPNEVYTIPYDAMLAVALYREALSLENISYKILGYFKILNIFWNGKTRDGKNELVEGLRSTLTEMEDTECIKRITEIERENGDAANYLYKSCRCAVAHAYSDPIVRPG